MGCWKQQCRRSYHLPCAISHECVYEFYDPYKSYCHVHYDANTLNSTSTHNETDKCGICQEEMQKYSAVNSLTVICCDDKQWYHKVCFKKAAFSFGSDFDCPSCGNKEEFQVNMQLNGIYIPTADYCQTTIPK